MSKIAASIITATYNSEKTIKRTLESILNQTATNFEYIIIDGMSNDKTISIIKSFEKKFKKRKIKFSWISEKDNGIYEAFNKGIKLSQGNWISFLGSDDIYLKNALEKYVAVAENKIEADFIHSKVKLMNQDKVLYVFSEKWRWSRFKRYMKIAHVGSFHNKKFFENYGNFNENYKIAGDYEMLLRAKNKLKTVFINQVTVEMNDGGVSNKNIVLAFKEVRKAKIETGKISKPIVYFDYYFSLLKYYVSSLMKSFNLIKY